MLTRHFMWQKLIRTDNSFTQCLLRIALGVVFFPHGAQKVLGWWGGQGFSATLGAFTGQGMPAPVALLVMFGEFLGAIGLVVGLLSRVAAFGIFMIMTGAIFLVHRQFGFFMNWSGSQPGEGVEYHLLAIGIALAVVLRGSGCCSLDRALMQKYLPSGRPL